MSTASPSIEPVFKGDFVDLKLSKIESLSHNVKHFTFDFPSPEQTSGLHVASALFVRFTKPNGEIAAKPYTPVSDTATKGKLEFIIKKYEGGVVSSHIFDLKVGESLSIKGPILKYKWEANKHNEITLLGGGTGITPLYQLIHTIIANPEDKTKITLIYGNLTPDGIILKKELEALAENHADQFKVHFFVDKPDETWKGNTGYISKDFLEQNIPLPSAENVKVFVCGPPGFYKALSGPKISPTDQGELTGTLKELGYTKDQVFKF